MDNNDIKTYFYFPNNLGINQEDKWGIYYSQLHPDNLIIHLKNFNDAAYLPSWFILA